MKRPKVKHPQSVKRPLVKAGLAVGAALPLALPFLPSPASSAALEAAEARVLARVKTPLEHHFIRAGGHTLHTVLLGDPAKPPLVMLHGHGGGLGVFAGVFDALATAYRVYALDLLGWGRSSRPPFRGKSPAAAQAWWVASLEAWRRAVGLERFTLLGHSMGGFVAASYALARPHHLTHLILVSAAGLTRPVALRNGVLYNLPPQRVVRLAGTLGPALVRARTRDDAATPHYPQNVLTDYYYQLSAAPGSGEFAFAKLIGLKSWKRPLLGELHRLRVPTTLLWGEDDTLVSPQDGVKAHARLPKSELVLLPGVGHAPYSEAPEAFVGAVLGSSYRTL